MEFTSKTGKHHFIVVVAEGVGHVSDIAKQIEAHTGIETRPTVLDTCSEAVHLPCETVWQQARWGIMQ